jgi:DNA helicase TIP49 (TBP-interacting protein)
MSENRKELTYLVGHFESMTPIEIIEHKDRKKRRSVVTIVTEDEQKLFLEIREAMINKISKLGIVNGDMVKIGFVFLGSEKGERKFNNLFLNSINYAS